MCPPPSPAKKKQQLWKFVLTVFPLVGARTLASIQSIAEVGALVIQPRDSRRENVARREMHGAEKFSTWTNSC